ncbi:MAG: adenosylcobinamide-GDP ribazoletransferase [Eubacterium sp.]|nr:adenosylcobinamide-GDP ribazoletransferase [Eubacterium sp.]
MKNLITAFFMAWGNFLSLPCPYKHWDSKLKNQMLAFLPGVGAVAGALWVALGALLLWLGIPGLLTTVAMTFYIYIICGFLHLDGFMDVNDAVMSRRPLEDRQRILKDSTVGAFAVISVVFLVLAAFSAMYSFLSQVPEIPRLLPLFVIPVASRAVSGACVLGFEPMGTSQYKEDHREPRGRFIAALAVCGAVLLGLAVAVAAVWTAGDPKDGVFSVLATALVTMAGTFLACLHGRRQLDGMNGDIAGYSICVGELCGMIALALMMFWS